MVLQSACYPFTDLVADRSRQLSDTKRYRGCSGRAISQSFMCAGTGPRLRSARHESAGEEAANASPAWRRIRGWPMSSRVKVACFAAAKYWEASLASPYLWDCCDGGPGRIRHPDGHQLRLRWLVRLFARLCACIPQDTRHDSGYPRPRPSPLPLSSPPRRRSSSPAAPQASNQAQSTSACALGGASARLPTGTVQLLFSAHPHRPQPQDSRSRALLNNVSSHGLICHRHVIQGGYSQFFYAMSSGRTMRTPVTVQSLPDQAPL